MKKIFIISAIVLLLIASGFLGYRVYLDYRVESSKAETETLAKKEIVPIDLPIISSSSSETQSETQSSLDNPINSTPNPVSQSSQSIQASVAPSRTLQNLSGSWTEIGSYKVSGSAQIIDTLDRTVLQLSSDFKFGGAPDPVIYLSSEKNPRGIDNAILIGALNNYNGASAWEIDPDDLKNYNGSIMLWCKAFNVNMGLVQLN